MVTVCGADTRVEFTAQVVQFLNGCCAAECVANGVDGLTMVRAQHGESEKAKTNGSWNALLRAYKVALILPHLVLLRHIMQRS